MYVCKYEVVGFISQSSSNQSVCQPADDDNLVQISNKAVMVMDIVYNSSVTSSLSLCDHPQSVWVTPQYTVTPDGLTQVESIRVTVADNDKGGYVNLSLFVRDYSASISVGTKA